MVKFQSIYIEGFNSVSNAALALDTPGLTFIKAANGVGKSTLFAALYWGLYGKHPKGLTASQVVTWKRYRTKNFRGTRVVVYFSVGEDKFMMCRHYKFKGTTRGLVPDNALMLFKADETGNFSSEGLVTELHKKDVQTYVEDLIGMDEKAFSNALFFAQTAARLIEESDGKKRELFDRICEVEWVKAAQTRAKEKLLYLEGELLGHRRDLEEAERSMKLYQQNLLNFKNILDNFQEVKHQRRQKAANYLEGEMSVLVEVPNFQLVIDREAEEKKKLKHRVELIKEKVSDEEKKVQSYREMYEKVAATVTDYDPNEYDKFVELERKALAEFRRVEKELAGKTSNFIEYERQEKRGERDLSLLDIQLRGIVENCPTCGSPLSPEEVKEAREAIKKKIKAQRTANEVITREKANIKKSCDVLRTDKELKEEILRSQREKVSNAREVQNKHVGLKREVAGLKQKYDIARDAVTQAKKDLNKALEEEIAFSFGSKQRIATETARLKEVLAERERVHQERVNRAKKALVEVENEQPPELDLKSAEEAIAHLKSSVEVTQASIAKVEADIEVVEFWGKTGFAPKGLKSFVFQSMLKKLNATLAEYAARLGVKVNFKIDLNKVSKPIVTTVELDGYPVDFKELSGGQQQKVNLILMFALFDIIGKGKANLMVLDEPFKFLDAEAREVCFELINLKVNEGVGVFCVTHLLDIDAVNANNIYLEQENGLTKII